MPSSENLEDSSDAESNGKDDSGSDSGSGSSGSSSPSASPTSRSHGTSSPVTHDNTDGTHSRGSVSRSNSADSERSTSRSPAHQEASSDDGRQSVQSNRSTRTDRSRRSRKSAGSDKSGGSNSEDDTYKTKDDSSEDEDHSKTENESGGDRKRKRVIVSDDSGSDVNHETELEKRPITDDSDNERKTHDSSDESSASVEASATAEALFGDASDISSDDEDTSARTLKTRGDTSADERDSGAESEIVEEPVDAAELDGVDKTDGAEEVDGEKEAEEPVPETRIDVEIPKITSDLGREIHFVKLPNFLSVETRPFDSETYEDEIDEEETLDEEGRARLKLKVENTIRWREVFNSQGEVVKESNARFVRWSDGSLSLHLGDEIFDVYRQPLQGDHNHLFIRQGTGLQGQAVFRTKLTFRPHSTESFTHRKMTLSLADRSQKTAGIKVLSQVGADPEQNRHIMIKKEEEKLRASMRRESKQKRVRERGASRGIGTSYLEPDAREEEGSEDEGTISLAAIKNKYKKGAAAQKGDIRPPIYSSDEEGSDFEARRAKKVDKARALKESDEESEKSASGSGSLSGSGDEAENHSPESD